MRKIRQAGLLGLALAAAFAFGQPAHAQGMVSFGIGGGPSFGIGDVGDAFDTGFHVQGSVRIAPPLLPLSARGDVLFQRMPETAHDDHHLDILAGIVNGVFTIPSILIHPYFIGGAGIYSWTTDDIDGRESDMGINIGAGVRAGLGGINVFGELRFHNVFTSGDGNFRFVPLTVGLLF